MKAAFSAVLVAILLMLAALFLIGGDGTVPGPDRPDDPGVSPEPDEDGYPEGVEVDLSSCTVSFDSPKDWKVYDLLSSYMVKERYTWCLYEGYGGTGDQIQLEPGMYRISVAGAEFEVVFPGTLHRTSEWTYDLDGRKCDVTVSYDIDVGDLAKQRDRGRAFNVTHDYLFSELPTLVSITDDIRSLESSLRSAFSGIGGNPDDRQDYADFLASFAQCAIGYPYHAYDSDGASLGEDYSIYGQSEYWALPLETLNLQYGDCEDTSVLLCALYTVAGYKAATGGSNGHVFCGVALDDFTETSKERLKELDPYRPYKLYAYPPVEGSCSDEYSGVVYYAVETIYSQLPVGYIGSGTRPPGSSTFWGPAGFYPYQGAESGIQLPS